MWTSTFLYGDEDVRHVGHEVDDTTTRGCQLCFWEEDTDQETKHSGCNGSQRQEDKDDVAVAVGKNFTSLKRNREKG